VILAMDRCVLVMASPKFGWVTHATLRLHV